MNLTMYLCLLFLTVFGISCSPHNIMKNSGNFPLVHRNAEVSSLRALNPRSKKWHLEPMSVTKISNKRKDQVENHSVSEKSHSVFSDLNGKRQGVEQDVHQVAKNGKLLSKIFHQQMNNAEYGQKPYVEDMTEVDIPELNVHEEIVNNNGVETAGLPSPSAAQLAGYVLETGDQASVVQFLEIMLTEGKISEEEALVYVETIKSHINEAEKALEQTDNEEENIREILLERNLEEAAMEQKMQEEETAKAEYMRSIISAEDTENESIHKVKTFLERSLKEGRITKSLYNHLKEALIESAVEVMGQDANVASSDYAQY